MGMFGDEAPIQANVWDSKRALTFDDAASLIAWATREMAFWELDNYNSLDQSLVQIHRPHVDAFRGILGWTHSAESYEKQADVNNARQMRSQIKAGLAQIESGAILTSECRQHRELSRLKQIDPAAFILLAAGSRANGRDALHNVNVAAALAVLARKTLDRSRGDSDVSTYRDELATLKNVYEAEVGALRAQVAALNAQNEAAAEAERLAVDGRSREWSGQREAIDSQWNNVLRIYAEKVALTAPATYWNTVAARSKSQAIAYSIGFVAVLAAGIGCFIGLGIPHLAEASTTATSALLASLPVLVPAFAFVWALRILGRLLSESLQLNRDAKEREVMVMTFLALMNDETGGKALVSADDRILILHSLFRPSSVTATDDAPPVHWFDILKNKYKAG